MTTRKKHSHNYHPHKRINRILIFECACGQRRTDMIKAFTPEKAKELDELIANLNKV